MKQLIQIKTLLFSAFVVVGLTACARQIIQVTGEKEQVRTHKKFALVEVVIGPPELPVFPLLDAGIYRGAFNGNAPQIAEIHKEKIQAITEAVGSALRKSSGSEVMYGKALVTTSEYMNCVVKEYPVALKHPRFPEAILMKQGKNLLDFGTNEYIQDLLDKAKPTPETMASLATALNVDITVIGIVTVPTITSGMFGISGARIARVALYFFDHKGKFLLKGYGQTKPESSSPGDVGHYEVTLEKSGMLTDSLASAIFKK